MKKFPNNLIGICTDDAIFFEPLQEFKANFKDQSQYATKELDPAFLEPKGQPPMTTIFFNSNHAHDTATRRSITGVLVIVGSTPVSWMSKHQGTVATLTYRTELCAMCTAAEEAISI